MYKSIPPQALHRPSIHPLKERLERRSRPAIVLKYIETSQFGPEYKSNGTLTVAGRPHITGMKREFFAEVTMKDDIIQRVT
jgi:hypothetical protein